MFKIFDDSKFCRIKLFPRIENIQFPQSDLLNGTKTEREILCYDYNINLLTVLQCRIINKYKFLCVWSDLSLYLFFYFHSYFTVAVDVYYCLHTFDLIFIFILLLSVVTCYSLLTIMKIIFYCLSFSFRFHFISQFIYFLTDIQCPISIFFMFLYYLSLID